MPEAIPFPAPGSAEELKEFGRELLADLEAGKLVAVAVVRGEVNGETRTGWAWDTGADSARLLGGAALLGHRLAHELDCDDD